MSRAAGGPGLSRRPIAALTPTRPADSAQGPGGSPDASAWWKPHAHLDKTFTIERCRPAQAGCWRQSTPCTSDRHYSTRADIQHRASAALAPGGSEMATHLRSHVDGLPPTRRTPGRRSPIPVASLLGAGGAGPAALCFASRRKRRLSPDARQQRGALPAGRLHPLLQPGRRRHGKSAVHAACWDLDLILHIDEELSEVSQG